MPKNSEHGRKLFNLECTLMLKAISYPGRSMSEMVPECRLPGSILPSPLINMPTWLSDKFANGEVVSNVDSLRLSEAFLFDEGIYVPSGAETSFVKAPENHKRRLLSGRTTGNKSLRFLHVLNEGQEQYYEEFYYDSTYFYSNRIFGAHGDEWNLSAFAICSNNQLTFSPGGSGNGVLDIELSVENTVSAIVTAALLQYDTPPALDDHVSTTAGA